MYQDYNRDEDIEKEIEKRMKQSKKKSLRKVILVVIGLLLFVSGTAFGPSISKNIEEYIDKYLRIPKVTSTEIATASAAKMPTSMSDSQNQPTLSISAQSTNTTIEYPTGISPTSTPTKIHPTETVQTLEYCNNPPQKICFNSFSLLTGGLLITIKFPPSPDYQIYLMVNDVLFKCVSISGYPDRYYCDGPMQKLNIETLVQVFRFKDEKILAEGFFSFFEYPTPTPRPEKNKATSYP